MNLNNEIIELLNKEDCNIIGFADLQSLSKEVRQNFDRGILIGLSYSKEAMQSRKNGDMQQYYDEWKPMNPRLDELAVITERFLVGRGHKALAKVQSTVVSDTDDWKTVLPHKTVATLSGIGWVGKCAMLVTDEVGSALRITVVLTNAPLECGVPVTESKCPPNCTACIDVCPGKAHKTNAPLWSSDVDRDSFFDVHACYSAARKHAKENLDIDLTLCGLCISVCPFTKNGLGYN